MMVGTEVNLVTPCGPYGGVLLAFSQHIVADTSLPHDASFTARLQVAKLFQGGQVPFRGQGILGG